MLKTIAEVERPCLEACLRYLRFGEADGRHTRSASPDSESSSEGETSQAKQRNVARMMRRGDKNVAEPRTSQGVFCPNGKKVLG
jgi:WD repeat-containing protein 59